MAEDQDQEKEKKPKTTLIKHRKGPESAKPTSDTGKEAGESSAGGEQSAQGAVESDQKKPRRKAKVVVKRKPRSAQQPSSTARSAQEQGEEAAKAEPAARATSEVAGGESRDQPAARSSSESATGSQSGAEAQPESAARATGKAGDGAQSGARPAQPQRPQPAPYRRPGSTGKPIDPSARTPRPGPGKGGPQKPGGPHKPGGPQRGGGGVEARTPRPGGPARQGGPSGDRKGPPPAGEKKEQRGAPERKPSSRKYYKSKKQREQFSRRERHQEKEIQYKQKQKDKPQRAKAVPKEIDIMEVITVSDLARKMNLKASDLIGKLMNMGMMVTINQQIDAETAEILASEYGCKVNIVSLYDEAIVERNKKEPEDVRARPAIVTVMGHVDHGKTKLLDAIRRTHVVEGESGGITQHIGAYQVDTDHGKVTFLDTPGHEAFTLMRARGAQVTDIVILVVAADDGVMPQTREAVDHARAAKVPIIVAVNKIDRADANPDRVKQQLSELDLMPEEWGGSTLFCEVSALKEQGVKELLETVALQSELLELKAGYDTRAEGKVIETRIDAGRGTVCSMLVEKGVLRVGDNFVAGVYPGRVRAMFNDRGERVKEAVPSMPVEITGLGGMPDAGDPFEVTEDERTAREVGEKRQELRKMEEARNVKKITLDNLYDTIQEGEIQELKVVIKGDVHGSVEALRSSLEKLSTAAIRLAAIRAAAGAINESDVMLASASNAIIVGFHVRPTPRAQELAEREKVEIRKYGVIYDAIDDIRKAMEGMLAPELREETIGQVEVRDTFKVPKIGTVAGCRVTSGQIRRNAKVRLYRDGVEIHSGKVVSLKRFQDDAKLVEAGYECGVGIERFNDIKPGDQIEVIEVKEIQKSLDDTRSDETAVQAGQRQGGE